MRRTLLNISAVVGLSVASFAQDPAGNAFHIDYDDFQSNGELHWINCGNDGSLNPGANMTIETWIKPYTTEWNQKIAGKNNGSFNSGYSFGMITGKVYTEVWTPSGNEMIEGFMPPIPNPYYWVHIAMVYDGSTQKAYINGEYAGEASASGDITPDSEDFIIGIAPWDLANFQYFGSIDEMRVWNTARTEAEIKQGMFIEAEGSEAGLVAYYGFNETTGMSLTDLSPSGNDGALSANCDDSNWINSRAVIGRPAMEDQMDVNGLWNAIAFTDPRFVTTDNGLSMIATDIPENDYIVYGHDGEVGTSTEDNPSDAPADMVHSGRIWYITNAGDMRADLIFDLDNVADGGDVLDASQPAENYTLLKRDGTSGEFVAVAGGDAKTGSVITFENALAKDGYYALAVSGTAVIDDDDVSVSEFTGVNFGVYPNPATENVIITLPTNMHVGIEVYNTMGQVIYTTNTKEENISLPLDGVNAGVYTVVVTELTSGNKGQQRIVVK